MSCCAIGGLTDREFGKHARERGGILPCVGNCGRGAGFHEIGLSVDNNAASNNHQHSGTHAQQAAECLKGLREVWEDEAVTTQAHDKLQHALWSQVEGARQLLLSLQRELSTVTPSTHDTTRLVAAVDRMDGTLGTAKRHHAAALHALGQQALQLEEEVVAAAMRLEEDVEPGVRAAGGAGGGGAGGGGRALSAARPAGQRGSEAGTSNTGSAVGRAAATSRCSSAEQRRSDGGGGGTLAPEVTELNDFMDEHGETGGWEAEDHGEFVSVLKACAGDYAQAVTICCERMIGYTKQDIIRHARWHMDLLDLQVRQRMALARWRAVKEADRAQVHARAALMPASALQTERDQSVRVRRSAQQSTHRAVEKELVRSWKDDRDTDARRRAGKAEAAAAAGLQAEQRARADRQHANRERIEVYQAEKDQLQREALRRSAVASAERAACAVVTPQQVARVRRRTQEHLRRVHSLVVGKEEQARHRQLVQQSLLDKVVVAVPRDPQRLFQPTEAAARRAQAVQEDRHEARDSTFILHVSHRVVPTWRTRDT